MWASDRLPNRCKNSRQPGARCPSYCAPALNGVFIGYWDGSTTWWRAATALFRRLGNAVLVRRSGSTLLAKLEPLAPSLIDLGAVTPFIRRQGHHRIIDRGINRHDVFRGTRGFAEGPVRSDPAHERCSLFVGAFVLALVTIAFGIYSEAVLMGRAAPHVGPDPATLAIAHGLKRG